VLRDFGRYNLHEPFLKYLHTHLATVRDVRFKSDVEAVEAAIARFVTMLGKISAGDSAYQNAHARRLIHLLAQISQAVMLLVEAQREVEHAQKTIKPDVITYFINKHLRPNYDPMLDETYLPRLEKLMMAY
jgi:hypothetical protein